MTDHATGRRSSPLDDDDLLGEILLRVPPLPSSLPRISLVCKRWRRIVSDPWLLRRFLGHHRKAPLLGFFEPHYLIKDGQGMMLNDLVFNPILEPPDRIPPQRFSLGRALAGTGPGNQLLLRGCRHGRVILTDMSGSSSRITVFVCDPVTGGHDRLVVPEEFTSLGAFMNGTVFCAASEQGHMHGACHSSPFKVILVYMSRNDCRPIACVYSSETGMWGNVIRHGDHQCKIVELSSTLIARALYWKILYVSQDEEGNKDFMPKSGVLKFNLDKQSLIVLKGPPIHHSGRSQIIKTADEGVGLVRLSYGTMQLQVWHSNVNCHDVATWVLFKAVDLYNIFGLQEHERWPSPRRRDGILGYDEDGGVIFICVDSSLFLFQLDSMQFMRLYERIERQCLGTCHPFRSFYTAGTATAGVGIYGGDDILHDS